MRWRASKRDYDNKPQPECKLCNKMTINLEWVPVFWGLGTISQNDFIVGAPWRYYIFKSCDFAPIFPLLWTLFVPFGFFCFVSWYLAAGLNANDIRLCCFRLSFSLSLDYIVALFVFVSKTNTQFVEIAKGFLLTLPLEDILYMLFTETQQIYANNCSFGKQRVSSRRVLRQRKMEQSKKNPANRKKRRLKWLRAGFSSGKRNS